MKKALRLLPIFVSLVIGACTPHISSAETTSGDLPSSTSESTSSAETSSISEITSSSTSSSSSSSISSSSSSSSSSSEAPNPAITESKWGREAAQVCFDTLGVVFPYLEANAFEYEVTTDDFGDKAVWFYLYYDSQEIAEEKIVDYAWAAYEQERYECVVKPTWFMGEDYSMWQQNVLYADKVLSDKYAIEIQALASIKSYNGKLTGCLGIYGFSYIPNLDPSKFPTYPVEYVLGENHVPALELEDIEYSFSFDLYNGSKILIIAAESKKHTIEMEEEYFYNLLDAHYHIYRYSDLDDDFTGEYFSYPTGVYPEYEDNYCYYAYDEDNTHVVYFEYDLNKQYLHIEIMKLAPQA